MERALRRASEGRADRLGRRGAAARAGRCSAKRHRHRDRTGRRHPSGRDRIRPRTWRRYSLTGVAEPSQRDCRDRGSGAAHSRPRPIERTGTFSAPVPFEEPLAPHGIRRSKDPARFQIFELRSVMPELSVTTTGNCAPAIDPANTVAGLLINDTVSWRLLDDRVQIAFTPHMTSEVVFVSPPAQAAGPAFVAGPQSLSVKRMVAFGRTCICSLKSMTSLSPV